MISYQIRTITNALEEVEADGVATSENYVTFYRERAGSGRNNVMTFVRENVVWFRAVQVRR